MATSIYNVPSPDIDWTVPAATPSEDQEWHLFFNLDLFEDPPSTSTPAFAAHASSPPRSPKSRSPLHSRSALQTVLSRHPKRRAASRPSISNGVSHSPIIKRRHSKSASPVSNAEHVQHALYWGVLPSMAISLGPVPNSRHAPQAPATAHHPSWSAPTPQFTDFALDPDLALTAESLNGFPVTRRLSSETSYHYPCPQKPYHAVQRFENQTNAYPLHLLSPPMSSSPALATSYAAFASTPTTEDIPLFSPVSQHASLDSLQVLESPTPYYHLPVTQSAYSAPIAPCPIPSIELYEVKEGAEVKMESPAPEPTPRKRRRPRKLPQSAESSPRSLGNSTPSARRTPGSGSSSSSERRAALSAGKSPRQATAYAGVSKSSKPASRGHNQNSLSHSSDDSSPGKRASGGRKSSGGGLAFVNYTTSDKRKLLNGVAPSGSSKTRAKREKEAAEQKETEIRDMMVVAAEQARVDERRKLDIIGKWAL